MHPTFLCPCGKGITTEPKTRINLSLQACKAIVAELVEETEVEAKSPKANGGIGGPSRIARNTNVGAVEKISAEGMLDLNAKVIEG